MTAPLTATIFNGKTQVFGIIGYPIEHTLSPPMQNAALLQLGVNGVYVPFPVHPDQVEIALSGLWALGVQGFNVTIPHKQVVMPHLATVTEIGQSIGAVNTVWRTELGWAGTNTDVTGFIAPLEELSVDWAASHVVILGNGGAARAVVAGCTLLGCKAVWVVGRDQEKLQRFAASWKKSPLKPTFRTCLMTELTALLPQTRLVVNTTPLGMSPHIHASPVTQAQANLLPEAAIAYDLIYTPRTTQFLSFASQRGLVTINGAEMLVQQGAAALEIWLRKSPPVLTMRQALQACL